MNFANPDYRGAQKRCDYCGGWMDDAGQTGWLCQSDTCPNSWGGAAKATNQRQIMDTLIDQAVRISLARRPYKPDTGPKEKP